jgi:hypothetical protein
MANNPLTMNDDQNAGFIPRLPLKRLQDLEVRDNFKILVQYLLELWQ